MTESTNKRRPLTLKKNYYDSGAETGPEATAGRNNENPSIALQKLPAHAQKSSAYLQRRQTLITLGWLFFVALGAALVYLRFFYKLSAPIPIPLPPPDAIKRYGMIAVGVVYLCSIYLAIRDNMFDGLLALIVPFYPFYYLFFCAGSILLRALTAALLAAFGFDCLVLLQAIALKVFDLVSVWIQNA